MSTKFAQAWWLAWEGDMSDEEVRARFQKKLGYAPDEIHRKPDGIWAGPIKEASKPTPRPEPTSDLIVL